jgi:hypothetical protein
VPPISSLSLSLSSPRLFCSLPTQLTPSLSQVAYDILKDVWEQDIVDCTICNMGLGDNCTVERQYDYWLGMVSNGIFIFAGLYVSTVL